MDDIKKNIEEIKEYTMDRLKMPIFFYYFVILLVWNWDIILLVLKSESSIEIIIEKIKGNHFEPSRYLWPLAIAIGGNVVFPFIMMLIEFPLAWINKKRNDKAGDVEYEKAKQELNIQRARTGAISLKELQDQINNLTADRTNLSKQIDDQKIDLNTVNNKIPELESLLKKEQLEKEKSKQDVIQFESHIGYYDLHEEVESFKEKIIILNNENHSENRVLDLLKKIYNEESSSLLMAINSSKLFHDFKRLKFLEEYQSDQVERVKLTPYAIKFMYWLYGSESPNKSMDVVTNKDIRNILKVLKRNNILVGFEKYAYEIKNKNAFTIDDSFDILVSLNLIEEPNINSNDFYKLTALGEHVYSFILKERLELESKKG